jgi:hypothetical protein
MVLLSEKLGCAIISAPLKTGPYRVPPRLYTSKVLLQAFFRVSTLRSTEIGRGVEDVN